MGIICLIKSSESLAIESKAKRIKIIPDTLRFQNRWMLMITSSKAGEIKHQQQISDETGRVLWSTNPNPSLEYLLLLWIGFMVM